MNPITTLSVVYNQQISYVLNPIIDRELIKLIRDNNWGLNDDVYQKQLELNPSPKRTLESIV